MVFCTVYFEDSVVPGRQRIVIPPQLRRQLLLENHSAMFAGHFTPKKLMQRVSYYYYWPRMKADVYQVCVTCLYTQGHECIVIDIKEFDVSSKGNKYIYMHLFFRIT